MQENLPDFFGFEAVGVLIYNFESNWLFTDPDQAKDGGWHSSSEESDKEEEGKATKTPLSKTPAENPQGDSARHHDPEVREKEIHKRQFMQFPCNSGISGHVFQTGQLYVSNNAAKETKFQDEIDNQSSMTDVKNFLIGPVFGERKDIPNGIIQFINKKGGGSIT